MGCEYIPESGIFIRVYGKYVYCTFSAALGQGWRLGFLGLLHMDVFMQRLEQEHNASVIVTAPNVPYKSMCVSVPL